MGRVFMLIWFISHATFLSDIEPFSFFYIEEPKGWAQNILGIADI